jgi:hypothetical protein
MPNHQRRDIDCQIEEFRIGDRVTAKSVPAKSRFMGKPIELELANHPSLIGVELTIVDILSPWILCTRFNSDFVPALTVDDLELLEAISSEVQA